MEQNKTDWSEKRFQIVLKLISKKEGGCYLDPQRIEQEANELMRYLQQFEEPSRIDIKKELLEKIAHHIDRTKNSIQQAVKTNSMYYQNPSNEVYAKGCQCALSNMQTYISKLLDDSGTN